MKKYLSFVAMLLAIAHNAYAATNQDLLDASFKGNVQKVTQLLADKTIDVNFKGAGNQTALQKAASQSHSKVVELLLAAGANPNAADKQRVTPLIAAIMSYPSKKDRIAVEEMVNNLINAGANVNAQNVGKQTALMLAVATNLQVVVALLLAAKANISLRNSYGETAMDLVDSHGGTDAETIKALLEEEYERGITKGWAEILKNQD